MKVYIKYFYGGHPIQNNALKLFNENNPFVFVVSSIEEVITALNKAVMVNPLVDNGIFDKDLHDCADYLILVADKPNSLFRVK